MSRSGYSDDCENLDLWRGTVARATKGKRGQRFFHDLIAALDAMPEKSLITGQLEEDGEVCAIGALGRARSIDMTTLDPEEPEDVAKAFDIAPALAAEVVYMNDERFDCRWVGDKREAYTPEKRWELMREWAVKQLAATEPRP